MSGMLIPGSDEGDPGEEPTSQRHHHGTRVVRELRGELGELICSYRDPENSPRGGAVLWVVVALGLWASIVIVGLAWPE